MRARSSSPFSRGYNADSSRYLRSRTLEPHHHIDTNYHKHYLTSSYPFYGSGHMLRSTSPYLPFSNYDYDIYDRFVEKMGRRTPIYYSFSKRNHFTPSYWYHRAPRTVYYPFGGWANRRLPSTYLLQSTSVNSSHYPFYAASDTYLWRYIDSLDKITSINSRIRDLDYERAIRSLRFRHSAPSQFNLYSTLRDDVETNIRYRSMSIDRSDNPRSYYGVSYIRNEKAHTDNVKNRYKYLIKSADQKPVTWHAEDQVETGYDLHKVNHDTLPSILNTGHLAEHSRHEMLMDKAGVIPRLEKLKTDYIYTKSSTDHSKRLINNLKKLKDETFTRLSEPWTYGQYIR